MTSRTVLVTGANGYIGNAVARAFVRAGWTTYGLVRSPSSGLALAVEEILPVIGSIDNVSTHEGIRDSLPSRLDTIVSTTEDIVDYVPHYNKIIALLHFLSDSSTAAGTKPLVIFTSGCKDYGIGPHYHGAPGLSPHTENSSIKPPAFAVLRAEYAVKVFSHADIFSPVLVRPTNVHGRSSSYYRAFFKVGEQTAKSGKPLLLTAPPTSICHSLHVDDCGDAYVAIAAHPQREDVEGQVFNISARRYETVADIAKALEAEYGLKAGTKYANPAELAPGENPWPAMLIDFPQWTGSNKLRNITGWQDLRPLFSEGIHTYRVAYEAAEAQGHENIWKIKERVEVLGSKK
jgi:nucleoside-diphosphate-sugar epimerase